MSHYTRARFKGGTYFFTLVAFKRRNILTTDPARIALRQAIEHIRKRRLFEIRAFVLLPDHLHAIWTLPRGDDDYSTRWMRIKEEFTRRWLSDGGSELRVSSAARNKRLRGVWQQRFWEHTICDERDFAAHMDYIHFNPVKHGYVKCPHEWPYSSFQSGVASNTYAPTWMCRCDGRKVDPPDETLTAGTVGE